MVLIAPSLLSCDFTQLHSEIRALEKSGADFLHLDVMDGHFVPNLTFGPPIIKKIKAITNLPLDVHLMITNPSASFEQYIEVGADMLTFHIESENHAERLISQIKSKGIKVGIALNPQTLPQQLEFLLDQIDIVLVMSVNPGFGGQKFIKSQLQKIDFFKKARSFRGLDFKISVDGGINEITALESQALGADILVAGNFIFINGPDNYLDKINILKNRVL